MSDSGKQSEENDGLISQFLAFTSSSDASRAHSYLEMSGFDLQTAVGLFLEHVGGGSNAAAAAVMGEIRAPDEVQRTRLIGGPDSSGSTNAAAAMYAQEGDYLNTAFSSDYMDIDTDGILDVREIANRAAAMQAVRSATEQGDDDDNISSDDDVGDDNEASRRSSRRASPASRLQDMFAPPENILHKAGGFDGARNVARDARRWLLVNLQRDSDFACHALNRDVWTDDLVENLIKEGFIFWQAFDVSPEGRTYAERYSVTSYPHIAIIDPRTRRLMYRKEGWTQANPLTAEMFAEIAADFCSRHSFDRPPVLPRPSAGNGRSAVIESIGGSASAKGVALGSRRPKKELTEEQQLQAAIRASMNGLSANDDSDNDDVSFQDEDDDDDDDYIMEYDEKDDNDDDAACIEEALSDEVELLGTTSATLVPPLASAIAPLSVVPSFEEEIATMDVGEEPGAGARIMLRMPDGKRLVRKFRGEDIVKIIYAFVAQTNDDAKDGKSFELKTGYPPKDLIVNISDTIQNCGLAGDTITVRWKS